MKYPKYEKETGLGNMETEHKKVFDDLNYICFKDSELTAVFLG